MNVTNAMNNNYTVIDSSLFIKAHIMNPDQALCLTILNKLKKSKLIVPTLWFYEVTSVMAKIVYLKQINKEESKSILRQAMALDVEVIEPDEIQNSLALEWAFRLKRGSAYDCFYLAISDSLNVPFWTADKRLYNSLMDQKPNWLKSIYEN